LDVVVILGEGAIQLRLHRDGVLPGLHELLLSGLGPEYRVVVPLKHLRLLPRPLCDVLQQTTYVKWVLNTKGLTTQGCRLLTFIHCSAWRIASMC
jgi:hypothetical protein